jgi:hypothetical protein
MSFLYCVIQASWNGQAPQKLIELSNQLNAGSIQLNQHVKYYVQETSQVVHRTSGGE